MKWIFAILAFLCVIVGALVLTLTADPDAPATGPGERDVPSLDTSGGGALQRGTDAPGVGGADGGRTAAERYANGDGPNLPVTTAASLTGDLEVRVLLKTTRTPMPNADIWLLDRDARPSLEWQEAFSSRTERETYIRQHGTAYRTDREGLASVPRVMNGALLARTQGYWGLKEWVGPVTSPFDILLDPDIELRVLVVDGNELPIGNVPVSICLNDHELPYSMIIRPTVHPLGVATFTRLSSSLKPRADGKGYAVTLGIPRKNRHLVPIDPEHLPTEPIKLILPPVGKVRVRALGADGEPLAENMIIALGREVLDERSGRTIFRAETTRRTGSGEAYFPVVEVGAPLTIQFSGVARMRDLVVERVGPATAGEEALIEVEWDTAQPAIVGRAVARDGSPLVNRRGRYRLWASGRAAGGPPLATDEAGHFRMVVSSPWQAGSERLARLELWPSDGQGPPHESTLDLSYDAPPGDTDYGDIVFDAKPVLAAGLVLGGGAPVASAHVRCERLEFQKGKGGEEESVWLPVTDVSSNTGPEGTFTIYGDPGTGPLRLVVRRRGFEEGILEDLQPGATGLRVVLVEGELDNSGADKIRELEASSFDSTSGDQ